MLADHFCPLQAAEEAATILAAGSQLYEAPEQTNLLPSMTSHLSNSIRKSSGPQQHIIA